MPYFPPANPGTVTNVSGTAPVAVATGTTTPVVSVPAFVASGGSHAAGLVPDPGSSAGATKFLREDATFAVPAAGAVVQIQGPVVQSADNNVNLTSTTVADYPNMATISITTTAGSTLIVEVWGTGVLQTNNAYLYVQVDSGSNNALWAGFFSTNADYTIFGKAYITSLSAGAHTVKLRYKVDSGASFKIRPSTIVESLAMDCTEFKN